MRTESGNNGAIAKYIANKRKEKGYTQTDMAEMLNTKRRTYQRWESGDASLKQLQSICSHLNLKLIILPKELIE